MDHQQKLLATALELIEAGYYIYPLSLRKGTDGKKKPDVRVQWKEASTRDVRQIHDWFDQPRMGMSGIGIDCGRSGITVVDLDTSGDKNGVDQWNAFEWAMTSPFTATSVSGGKHLFFKATNGGIKSGAGDIAPHVDIRSVGGTIFCAPTSFDGRSYSFDGPIQPVADLPELSGAALAGIAYLYAQRGKSTSTKPVDIPDGVVRSVSHAQDSVGQALWKYEKAPDWNTIFGYAVQRVKLELGLAQLEDRVYDGDAVEEDIQAVILSKGPWDLLDNDDLKHIRNGRAKGESDPWVIVHDDDLAADLNPRMPLADLYNATAPTMPGDPYSAQAEAATELIEVLADRYLHCRGIGWLEWNGTEWATGDKMLGSPINDIRLSVLAATGRAARMVTGLERNREFRAMKGRLVAMQSERGKNAATDAELDLQGEIDKMTAWRKGWVRYQEWWNGVGVYRNLDALLKFVEKTPGRILVLASQLDAKPHLLNCPNGTVDLRTGVLKPHDPRDLCTQNTRVDYKPDAVSPLWDKARSAFAPGIETWLQRKVGEGAFGFPPRDDTILFCFGQGANGKSTLTDAMTYALGDYMVILHDKAILGNEHDHGTEKMVFRGARWTVLEELPEAQILRPALIKKLVGTGKITARAMRQDNVTFDATHHILVNSNHRPQVLESDHGTWRRLVSIPWPYTFRTPADIADEFDRPVDTRVRVSLRSDMHTRRAVLAWIVAGAVGYWGAGQDCGPRPEAVDESSKAWRAESDVFGSFFAGRLKFERGYAVSSKDVLYELNEYLGDMGKRPVSEQYVTTRLQTMDGGRGVYPATIRKTQKSLTVSTSGGPSLLPNQFRGWAGLRWI